MILVVKLLLAPLLVVGSSLAGRRWGPGMAGVVVGLPVVAGPILLITDLQHGQRFAARAANASLLGLVTLALFVAVFANASRAHGWAATLAIGWAACLVADVVLAAVVVAPVVGLCLAGSAAATAAAMMPACSHSAITTKTAWPRWDLAARAVATAALVLILTGAAADLGPSLTGVLAPFPIGISVVAAFVLAQHGSAHAVALLRGVLLSLLAFALFCFLIAVLLVPAGPFGAFILALCAAVAIQAVARAAVPFQPVHDNLRRLRIRRPRRQP